MALHYVETIRRELENGVAAVTIDGYTTRKTYLGAVHEIGKLVNEIVPGEGDWMISVKTEREARESLVKNSMDIYNYCFELEEVCCASQFNEETDEMEYEEGHFYFMIRTFEEVEETEETEEVPAIGDEVYTPRFCTVKISEVFRDEIEAYNQGFREPTHYKGSFKVLGKSIDRYHMEFCAVVSK